MCDIPEVAQFETFRRVFGLCQSDCRCKCENCLLRRKAVMQMKHISVNLRRVSYGANVFLVAVAATFSLCLAIGPEENMVMHTSPFVALINFNLLISYLVEFFEVIASIFLFNFVKILY